MKENIAYQFYDYYPKIKDMLEDITEGLGKTPRRISPKYFYDETGSNLFDAICNAPEYYPTVTEINIIRDNLEDISDCIGNNCILIEPGSGSSQKVREMLDVIQPHAYLPMDISSSYLKIAAHKLAEEYPWLDIHAVCTDFTSKVDLPYRPSGINRVAFFPGSSIGNFEPSSAVGFLSRIAAMLGRNGGLLIGVDLKKDSQILNSAYNDEQGYTAAFNLNVLHRINRECGADFDVDAFAHHAFYNEKIGRIEMHLISQSEQTIRINDYSFDFGAEESIHTENSYKYSIEEFQQLAGKAGFRSEKIWTDENKLFSLHYFSVSK